MKTNEENNNDDIHMGKLFKSQVEKKGIRVSWLAEQLHCHRNNIYKLYEKQWIDTHLLMRLCEILDYDFFASLSKHYQETRKSRLQTI